MINFDYPIQAVVTPTGWLNPYDKNSMKSHLTDEELIDNYLRTRANHCLETLYNRYFNKVYSRCLSITRDADKAKDYTQDIFIRMFGRLDRFQHRSSFATWLYSISYNYCMDQLRADKRLMTTTLDEQMEYYSADDTESIEYSLQQLTLVLNTMPIQEAALLRLKYQEGLDIRQIATQLNINDSAVKMRLKRSRERAKRLCQVAIC